ncbi:MAG: transposase [Candidatus Kerfeldbacteria bacterium]|nr:transposase [Candidatus Kerfeldbacteria bacterium]
MTQRAIDGDYIYFVTANVDHGQWYFVSSEWAEKLGQAIRTSCLMKKFDLLVYCILPNHFHLLVRKLPNRALESARCERRNVSIAGQEPLYLFPHRRLSSRRIPNNDGQHYRLGDLMKSIKGSFSRILPKGKFWHRLFNFRIVENEEHLANVVEYMIHNYRKMNVPEWYGQPPFVFVDWERIKKLW